VHSGAILAQPGFRRKDEPRGVCEPPGPVVG
jgi:hypothetical protein